MRVGILTSWNVPCGVFQYSARLADALKELGHEPVILAGRADEQRSVPEESEHEVHDVATIGMWRDDGEYSLDADKIAGLGLDAVHVQYQSMLFREPHLMYLCEKFIGPTAVTFHDNCQAPSFPYRIFDLVFTHRHGVGPHSAEVLPFGIEWRKPVVRTFGLGRSQADLIAGVCEENGWLFESAASHEPIHGGGQAWRTHEELIAWLRGADAIVLWYPPEPMAGSSQAARTALAARRLVVTNNTEWFSDLPDRIDANTPLKGAPRPAYVKVESLDRLASVLRDELFDGRYLTERSWQSIARTLVHRYQVAAY